MQNYDKSSQISRIFGCVAHSRFKLTMCITFLFTNPGGDCSIKYKLILINNRDEIYARSTQSATLMTDGDDLQSIYSIDLAGAVKGTWLGISSDGDVIRLGNLANVTGDDQIHGKRGRGPIVTNFIKCRDETIELQADKLVNQCQDYSSFNFLSVVINNDDIKTFYVSNTPKISQKLPPGFYGLGNSPLSRPFKKVDEGIKQFKEVLDAHAHSTKEELLENLTNILKNKEKFMPDLELTSRRKETAEHFSSIHVVLPDEGYGTRTRTIILVDETGNIDYVEETMTSEDPDGKWATTHLKIPKLVSQL